MNTINVKIAGIVAEIAMEYYPAPSLYHSFRTNEPPAYCITLTAEDTDFCIMKHETKAMVQIKTSCVMRKFSEALLDFDTILMHGAVVGLDNAAYLFTAPSSTGKTTHARLWIKNCPQSFIINGDKPFIRFIENGTVLACGSPWAGKEKLYTNTMVSLKAVILMERAEDNHIEQISFKEAFPTLLQQVYRPNDERKMHKTLQLIQRLSPTVTFWRFQCNNFKDDCFDMVYNALVRNQT